MRKAKFKCCAVVFLSMLLLFVVIQIVAAEEEQCLNAIKTYPITQAEQQYYTDELDLQTIPTKDIEQFKNHFIVDIDVSSNNQLLIGLDNRTVLICNSNAEIQCAIAFNQRYSDIYYLNWIGNYFQLILNRSNAVYLFDCNGNLVDISKQDPWDTFNRDIIHDLSYRTSVSANGYTYKMQKSSQRLRFAGDCYDTLTRMSLTGEEMVLFQSSSKTPDEVIEFYIITILFFVIFVLLLPCCIIVRIHQRKTRGKFA